MFFVQGLSRFMLKTPDILRMPVKQGLVVSCGLLLASCAFNANPTPKNNVSVEENNAASIKASKTQASKGPVVAKILTKPKFKAGKSYGTASERIVRSALKEVPRGGGRAVVGKPYKINGRWYKPKHQPRYNKTGIASWYGPNFHGRKTANGEIYDQTALSAAHPTLPLPSYVRVTNIRNNRSVIVRVNDRGPFHKNRIIDLSYRTAELLGTRAGGIAKVKVKYIGRARVDGQDEDYLLSSYKGPGSVEPSRIAARNKLLTYAGLSPDHNLVYASSAPQEAPPPTASPLRGVSPVLTTNNQIIPAQPQAVVSNQGVNAPSVGDPLILKPRVITPTHGGKLQPARLIKARPRALSGGNAYASEVVSASHVEEIFNKVLKPNSKDWQLNETQYFHVGTFTDRDHVSRVKDELSRFGTVNLTMDYRGKTSAIRIDLESRLPFAEKAIRQIVPKSVVLR